MTLPDALSIAMTSPAVTRAASRASTIFAPRSKTVSMSVVFIVSRPEGRAEDVPAGREAPGATELAGGALSISSSTTSPSSTSASSRILTPTALLSACVRASVLDISKE